jgi:NSS family neurotransmitter:Na+ symporter
MITYGSYISKRENLAVSAVSVGLADTLIAVLAGLVIFPALFSSVSHPPTDRGSCSTSSPRSLR